MAQASHSPCLHSRHKRTLSIPTVTQISQNIIKLRLDLLFNDISFRLSLVSWHLRFTGYSVAMCLRCGGMFNDHFLIFIRLLLSPKVQ